MMPYCQSSRRDTTRSSEFHDWRIPTAARSKPKPVGNDVTRLIITCGSLSHAFSRVRLFRGTEISGGSTVSWTARVASTLVPFITRTVARATDRASKSHRTLENSPAIHRWEMVRKGNESHQGRKKRSVAPDPSIAPPGPLPYSIGAHG